VYTVETIDRDDCEKPSDLVAGYRKEVNSGKSQISLDRYGQHQPGAVEAIGHSKGWRGEERQAVCSGDKNKVTWGTHLM